MIAEYTIKSAGCPGKKTLAAIQYQNISISFPLNRASGQKFLADFYQLIRC
jgi:hypothetical protein